MLTGCQQDTDRQAVHAEVRKRLSHIAEQIVHFKVGTVGAVN